MTTTSLPVRIQKLTGDIKADPSLNSGVRAMKARKNEFPDVDTAIMAGIAVDRDARFLMNDTLDEMWADQRLPEFAYEVIIGGGLHAAAYAVVREKCGYPKPLIIERDKIGGMFAITKNATWGLNSRNRPGDESLPGDGQALNFIPGARLQPYYLSNTEFQTNADLAFCIRMAVAEHAIGVSNVTVTGISVSRPGKLLVTTNEGAVVAGRVIEARGMGDPLMIGDTSGQVLDYIQFMRRMDQTFPLRGMRRVAVIGDGDSAKTVIESLTGQGPNQHMSVCGLDYVEQIDWYGPKVPNTCAEANEQFRTRYRRLAGLLPRERGQLARLMPFPRRAVSRQGFSCAYVNDRAYDCVIVATGFSVAADEFMVANTEPDAFDVAGTEVARQVGDLPWYQIGAMAAPRFTSGEAESVRGLPENRVAAFRLVPRTTTLAATLRKIDRKFRTPSMQNTFVAPTGSVPKKEPFKLPQVRALAARRALGAFTPQVGDCFKTIMSGSTYRITDVDSADATAVKLYSDGSIGPKRRFSLTRAIAGYLAV